MHASSGNPVASSRREPLTMLEKNGEHASGFIGT
jgi:hypothetical protein